MLDETQRIENNRTESEPIRLPGSRWDGQTPMENSALAAEELLPGEELDNMRNRWRDIQGQFVDEPRAAVQHADELVSQLVQRLTDTFSERRQKLESSWDRGQDASTEDLRQSLRQYRSFFDRLLAV